MLLRKKTLLVISISALLVLVLSSCEVVTHTTVNADGSGTFRLSIDVPKKDFGALLEQDEAPDIAEDEVLDYLMSVQGFGSVEELCLGMGESLASFEVEPTVIGNKKGGGLECAITFEFDDLDELMGIMDTDELTVAIDEEAETFTYRLEGPGGTIDEIAYFDELGIDISLLYKVTAPGTITETNGKKSGNTVTWDLLKIAEEGEDMSMYVISGTSGGGGLDTNMTLIIVLVGVVVLFLMSQKKKSSGEEM